MDYHRKDKIGLLASNQERGDVTSTVDAPPDGHMLRIESRAICRRQGSKFRWWQAEIKHKSDSASVITIEEQKTTRV